MFIVAALAVAALFGGTGTASAATAASTSGSTFSALADAHAAPQPAAAKPLSRTTPKAVTNTPLAGFCTLDGQFGATFVVSCSVVVAATAFIYCSNGNIFFWTFPGPGVYQGSGGPCIAIGYDLR
jgi:hypothetical protein